MVYLQINGQFRTHIFDFGRPYRYCQHIYIDFHECSQKTRSGRFIYKSTVRFERTYSILSNPTGLVNISTLISTHVLRRLVRDGYLQINSEFRTLILVFDWPNRYCQHIYIHFHTCSQKTRLGWFVYKSTVSFERIYSILSDPTGTVNISTSISTQALRRLG